MSTALTIGHLARQAGVNRETIRYYQRIGLLQEPAKPSTGFRVYPNEYIDRVRFIKRAQQLGFSLGEIADLLDLGNQNCTNMRRQAEEKKAQIAAQIKDLEALQAVLDRLIDACHQGDARHCPIADALKGKP
ncbi:MerR family transcriptional regulator [Thiolapillus brandeum]|uniref:MerR family transcriptional regulator mercuric resistance operon regulatory protein n=1 Tax=Thiolapillus brandeum TaxID=1076588 RepID=A0A7U6GJR2_9GAMM|nr:MerR family transcriptional regulator [Thiolapillus brandeum]BAO44897.1 MerR family transcriptional regulator mercuric resistance operon regulatory protein [Thiolapillus brandeum]